MLTQRSVGPDVTPPKPTVRSSAAVAHQRESQRRHAALVRAAVNVLTLEGCWVWKHQVGALKIGDRFVKFGVAGQSDIIGSMPIRCPESRVLMSEGWLCPACSRTGLIPRAMAVECKVGEGRLSPDQESFLAEAARRGWWTFVCRDTIDELVKAVRAMMERT